MDENGFMNAGILSLSVRSADNDNEFPDLDPALESEQADSYVPVQARAGSVRESVATIMAEVDAQLHAAVTAAMGEGYASTAPHETMVHEIVVEGDGAARQHLALGLSGLLVRRSGGLPAEKAAVADASIGGRGPDLILGLSHTPKKGTEWPTNVDVTEGEAGDEGEVAALAHLFGVPAHVLKGVQGDSDEEPRPRERAEHAQVPTIQAREYELDGHMQLYMQGGRVCTSDEAPTPDAFLPNPEGEGWARAAAQQSEAACDCLPNAEGLRDGVKRALEAVLVQVVTKDG